MATRFALVSNDEGDWIGLYEGGVLKYEGHSIDEWKLLELVGIPCDHREDVNLEKWGRCPANLADLDEEEPES